MKFKKFKIRNRWSDAVIFSLKARTLKSALEAAVKRGVDLRGANLEGANLKGASLDGASLEGANLRGSNLMGANLKRSTLEGANLRGSNLMGANLDGADLSDVKLIGADLESAKLENIKADFFKVLDIAPNEVKGLRLALMKGHIDGSMYEGKCACLVGTIANLRKCRYDKIINLKPDSDRLIERWFLMFKPRPRCKPARHVGARITLKWIDEWIYRKKQSKEI